MSDQKQPNSLPIDNLLAEYADQVASSPDPAAIPHSDQPELKQLQETVLQLARQVPDAPNPEASRQIKASVLKAYQKKYQARSWLSETIRKLSGSPGKSGYMSTSRRRQLTAIRVTAAAVLVIVAAFIILPNLGITGGSTSGAATGSSDTFMLIGGGVLLLGLIVWWWFGSRRK
jgi:LPXTG-motif cell wall-anchored protein